MARFQLVVLGGGPAGYTAAIRGAQLGGRVLLVEKERVGGVCLNKGCIPTKTILETARLLQLLKKSAEYGVEVGSFNLDFKRLASRRRSVVEKLVSGIEYLLESWEVKVVRGEGKIKDYKNVIVKLENGNTETYQYENLIIATGSKPSELKVSGVDGGGLVTSDEAVVLEEYPEKILIVGGGAVGVELAAIFSSLGLKVALVEIMPRILPLEDRDISNYMNRILRRNGVKVHVSSKLSKVKVSGDSKKAIIETPRGIVEEEYDLGIVAIGRRPAIEGLGLENVNVETRDGKIVVDEHMRTSNPKIYAAGDVVGGYMFAHVAFQEAIVAVENIFGVGSKIDYSAVPRCIYSTPEIACVGLSEDEALKSGHEVSVGKFQIAASGRGLTLGETLGFIKAIVDARSNTILGVHAIAPNASEIISEYTLSLKLKLKVEDIKDTIHPHPTISEAFKEAVLDTRGEAVHKVGKRKNLTL